MISIHPVPLPTSIDLFTIISFFSAINILYHDTLLRIFLTTRDVANRVELGLAAAYSVQLHFGKSILLNPDWCLCV